MKSLENLRDIQCFIGILVYYRRFIPEFARLAEPLTFLLRGKVPFERKEEQEITFNKLYKKLMSAPLLA